MNEILCRLLGGNPKRCDALLYEHVVMSIVTAAAIVVAFVLARQVFDF